MPLADGSGQSTALKPAPGAGPIRKRPRPTLSCIECRRKKLKCDRNRPCDQCLKSAHSGQCVYATRHDFHFANVVDAIDDLPAPMSVPVPDDRRDSVPAQEPRDSPAP